MAHHDPDSVARRATGEKPHMVTVNAGLLVAAYDCLAQYGDYASEMRKLGRGFYPDSAGFPVESVREWLLKVLEQAQKDIEAKEVRP